jgi:hypothetical protein
LKYINSNNDIAFEFLHFLLLALPSDQPHGFDILTFAIDKIHHSSPHSNRHGHHPLHPSKMTPKIHIFIEFPVITVEIQQEIIGEETEE